MKVLSAVFSVLILSSLSALAGGGGSGVRNSGHGLFCEGVSPRMVDTFLIEKPRFEAPFTPENFRSQLMRYLRELERQDFDLKALGFAELLSSELDRIGPSELWKSARLKSVRAFDEYLPFELDQVQGCEIRQISSFDLETWTPIKVRKNYRKLSDFERRALELHEALYILGARSFGHKTPVGTRELVAALLNSTVSDSHVLLALRAFTHLSLPVNDEGNASGLMKYRGTEKSFCPSYFAWEFVGADYGYALQLGLVNVDPASHKRSYDSFRVAGGTQFSGVMGQSTRYEFRPNAERYADKYWTTYKTDRFEVSIPARPVYMIRDRSAIPEVIEVIRDGNRVSCAYSSVALSEEVRRTLFRSLESGQLDSVIGAE